MNKIYYSKYNKYKTKYLNLLYGGTHEQDSLTVLTEEVLKSKTKIDDMNGNLQSIQLLLTQVIKKVDKGDKADVVNQGATTLSDKEHTLSDKEHTFQDSLIVLTDEVSGLKTKIDDMTGNLQSIQLLLTQVIKAVDTQKTLPTTQETPSKCEFCHKIEKPNSEISVQLDQIKIYIEQNNPKTKYDTFKTLNLVVKQALKLFDKYISVISLEDNSIKTKHELIDIQNLGLLSKKLYGAYKEINKNELEEYMEYFYSKVVNALEMLIEFVPGAYMCRCLICVNCGGWGDCENCQYDKKTHADFNSAFRRFNNDIRTIIKKIKVGVEAEKIPTRRNYDDLNKSSSDISSLFDE